MLTEPLRRLVRGRVEAGKARRFHARDNAKARAAYEVIVTQYPARSLSEADKKRISDYSNDVFGSGKFAPWLELYSAYRGKFLEGWIPENYFLKVLAPSWRSYNNIDAKTIARRILGSDRVPDRAYFINGFWLDRDHQHIENDRLQDYLFADADALFIKTDRSAQGAGVSKISRAQFDWEHLSRLGNLVVQSAIDQHPFFDRFTSDSVATLRVTTVKPPGRKAEHKASILRLGHGGGTVVTADAIRVPVVDDRGTLADRAADASWMSHRAHPDTHVAFAGERIPGFQQAVALCEKLHDQSPFSVLIGWDVAIDSHGDPVLMEWNQGTAGIALSEASLGPCFRDLGWEDVWRARPK
jgi:Sugar-transfer associated ATP-grasp